MLGGRYRLVHMVATGGMADVWEGVDDILTRAVAVKVLHPHLAADPGFQERFRREAISAARLSHPAIVATFDAGTERDATYIVMELVRGRTLRDLLRTEGRLPPATAVGIASQVAGALAHAHAAGVTHRDVKPSNILLCDEIAPGRVKIADFGIAKAAGRDDPDLTETGSIIGTARYLAPEQVDGGDPGPRADLYALGAVIFEMLTGKPPFDGATELATALAHLHEPPPKPRRLQPGIPRPLEALTLKLLAKNPDDRYQTADELRQALDTIDVELDDAEPFPVPARTPPGGVQVSARPPRRSWAPVAVVGGLAATSVLVGAMILAGDGDRGGPGRGGDGEPVPIAEVRSFDPEGRDRSENEREAPRAADGDPATAWESDRYNTRAFGDLKDGVGLVFRLQNPAELQKLDVVATADDWAASVYVGDALHGELPAWGEPVDTADALGDTASFDLGGTEGTAVLLWITDPGSENRAGIAEVTITG